MATLLLACGPSLGSASATDGQTSTETSEPSTQDSNTAPTTMPDCTPDVACASGVSCNGECVPEEDCADACCEGDPGCDGGGSTVGPPDGSSSSSSGSGTTGETTATIECATDSECPPLHLCEPSGRANECVLLPTPTPCAVINLDSFGETPAPGEIHSLSVLQNQDGFDDLVLGFADGAAVIHGRISFEPHLLVDADLPSAPVFAAAGGDFDGDGLTDIALGIHPDDDTFVVRVHLANGPGDYVAIGGDTILGPPRDIQAYRDTSSQDLLAQREPNGELVVWLNDGTGAFLFATKFNARPGLETFLVGNLSANPLDDLVLDYGPGSDLELRVNGEVYAAEGYPGRAGRTLHEVNLDGSASNQVVAVTPFDGWTMLEWVQPLSGIVTAFAVEGTAIDVDTGDLSDNEREDLVLRTEDDFVVVFGREDVGFVCQASFPADPSFEHMAVAELTSDVRPDVVVSRGDQFIVYEVSG